MAKYRTSKYKTGSFCGVGNRKINIIICEDKNTQLTLQKYVLNWYHVYLLHTGMDIMKVMIFKY